MILFMIIMLSLFLLWTVLNKMFIPSMQQVELKENLPLISVLVPLRNEERNVKQLIAHLKSLTYPTLEFILLDDQSTDRTLSLLYSNIKGDKRFQILKGNSLPNGWIGKVYACHQLQQVAKGDYLLFIDADVRLKPKTIDKALHLLMKYDAKLLTGFPAFEVPSFLSKILVPMQHFVVFFHLPIRLANYTTLPSTTAAHGAFMLFERKAYDKIGGHQSVSTSLVEDVHIARNMKKHGFRVLLANITDDVSCRMYETNREVWEGFLKNIYIGLGRSYLLVFSLTVFYSFFYLMPFIWFCYGLFSFQLIYIIPYFIICAQRIIVDWSTNQRLSLSLLMGLSVLSFIVLMNVSMVKAMLKKEYQWKGRFYS